MEGDGRYQGLEGRKTRKSVRKEEAQESGEPLAENMEQKKLGSSPPRIRILSERSMGTEINPE